MLTRTTAIRTSRQIRDWLLCWDCEQNFSTKGVNWVMRNCYRHGQGFRLQEALKQSTPLYDDGEYRVYWATKIPNIDIPSLVYFACSLFWRAAVHRWKYPNATVHIELGPYKDTLHRHLFGKEALPESVAIFVGTSCLENPINSVNFPHGRRRGTFRHYEFHIPGIVFDLYLGNALPLWMRTLCPSRSDLVFATDRMDQRIYNSLLRSFRGAARYLPPSSAV